MIVESENNPYLFHSLTLSLSVFHYPLSVIHYQLIMKPTVAQAMAAVDELHRQVVKNQETLDSRMSEFDREVKGTLDQWNRRYARDKENLSADLDDLKNSVTKKHNELSGRIDEFGTVVNSFKQVAEASRETTLDIKRTVDSLQESFVKQATEAPTLVPGPAIATLGSSLDTLQKSPWYPWLKFGAYCLLGVLAYHYFLVPMISRTVTPNNLPNLFRPSIDPNSPYGAATVEVSREPFRSDTASREAFGHIFARLDELVRTGQLNNFEAYYNEFGREMQGNIAGARYEPWAGVWSRLATVCHRYGGGANDLKRFNANLQAAAGVVAGRASDLPGRYDLSGSGPYDNGSGPAPYGDRPVATGPSAATDGTATPWPFLPNR